MCRFMRISTTSLVFNKLFFVQNFFQCHNHQHCSSLFPLFPIATRNIIRVQTNRISFILISRTSRLSTVELYGNQRTGSSIRRNHSQSTFCYSISIGFVLVDLMKSLVYKFTVENLKFIKTIMKDVGVCG